MTDVQDLLPCPEPVRFLDETGTAVQPSEQAAASSLPLDDLCVGVSCGHETRASMIIL